MGGARGICSALGNRRSDLGQQLRLDFAVDLVGGVFDLGDDIVELSGVGEAQRADMLAHLAVDQQALYHEAEARPTREAIFATSYPGCRASWR